MGLKTYVLAAGLLAAPLPAFAQVTTYTDAGAFAAASGPLTTETFSSCPGDNSGFSGAVSSTSGPCGGIVAGVTFAPQPDGQLYSAGAGQSTNPTTALGLNIFSSDPISITFDSAMSAFGADLFQNFGGGGQGTTDVAFIIALYGAGDVLIDTLNPLVSPNGGDFFGFTSTSPFVRVDVSLPDGFAVIDNVQFASATAVPEPATWAMFLLGFGAIGLTIRRRNSARSVAQLA